MTILLSTLGLVIAVASLLFSGWQARLLSRQTALQNATAGMNTLQQLFTWLHHVQQLFLENPKFLSCIQDGAKPDLTTHEAARLQWIVAMYCDVLNIGFFQQQTIPSTHSLDEWTDLCLRTLQRSAVVRKEVEAKPQGYPLLAALLPAVSIDPEARASSKPVTPQQ